MLLEGNCATKPGKYVKYKINRRSFGDEQATRGNSTGAKKYNREEPANRGGWVTGVQKSNERTFGNSS